MVEERPDVIDVLLLRDDQHPLLALAEHDLVGRHAGFPARDVVQVEDRPGPALGAAFHDRAGKPRGTEVLQTDDPVAMLRGELVAGLHQQLLHERVAHLDSRPHLLEACLRVRTAGEPAGPVDPVTAGVRPGKEQDVAFTLRLRAQQLLRLRHAHAHRVDERVAVVGLGEDDFAANRGDAEAVAIAADAPDDAIEQVLVLRVVRRAEAEGIEDGDRVGAHREDVADDAADTGRGALVRLDSRRVVVRFDLHHDAEAVADVDGARVFRAHLGEDVVAAGWEQLQERFAVLVAAVLAPERAEHPELDFVGLASELLDQEVVFSAGKRDGIEGGLVYWHAGYGSGREG